MRRLPTVYAKFVLVSRRSREFMFDDGVRWASMWSLEATSA